MLLRFIDLADDSSSDQAIDVIYTDDDQTIRFTIEDYQSPISQHTHQQIADYYHHYLTAEATKESPVGGRLINLGQYIGDQCLGEDHEMLKVVDYIEKNGYENLDVSIESDRLEFLAEPWELCILPESKYVLSAVARSFTRHCGKPQRQAQWHGELAVTSPVAENLPGLSDASSPQASKVDDSPLNILHITARSQTSRQCSNSFELCVQSLQSENAINYEIHPSAHWQSLQQRLKDTAKPLHLVHFEGTISNGEDGIRIELSPGHSVSLDSFVSEIVEANIPVVTLDANYNNDQEPGTTSVGFTELAKDALHLGLGNIIGLAYETDYRTAATCFALLFQKLTSNLTLEQALVETRKSLQAITQSMHYQANATPFNFWPLLQHFSQQSVIFFEQSAAHSALTESLTLQSVLQNLFGFSREKLPPENSYIDNGSFSVALKKTQQSLLAVIGKHGIGKTQLLHSLSFYKCYTGAVEFGFYFDYSEHQYTVDEIRSMVAPILGADSPDAVDTALTQKRCVFVFDNIADIVVNDQHKATEDWQVLNRFFKKLHAEGHRIILSGFAFDQRHFDIEVQTLELLPLSVHVQQQFLATILRAYNLADKTNDPHWQQLVDSFQGNAFLFQQLLPHLADQTAEELHSIIATHFQSRNVTEDYYQWQWQQLPTMQQGILLACASVQGLLIEMVMMVCNHNQDYEPATQWLEILKGSSSDEIEPLDQLLSIWQKAGFVKRSVVGHTIDKQCLAFLHKKNQTLEPERSPEHDLLFSQILCEGLSRLIAILLKQPNPNMSHHLLSNRQAWVEHFERLWFADEFRQFIKAKRLFDQLLQEAKLDQDNAQWCLSLLNRSKAPTASFQASFEANFAWLTLARTAIVSSSADDNNSVLEQTAERWLGYLLDQESIEQQQLPLFDHAVNFLTGFYQRRSDWHTCIQVCEKAQSVYREHEAWVILIRTLHSLAAYSHQLGNTDAAIAYEQAIIDDIPYDNSPEGFQAQQWFEVLVARLSREQTQSARKLFEQFKALNNTEQFANALENIEAEILYQEGNYHQALPLYCRFWSSALKTEQQQHLHEIQSKLQVIEANVGEEAFDEIYRQEAKEASLHPRDFALK